jgi:hypothetical protein
MAAAWRRWASAEHACMFYLDISAVAVAE